MNFDISRWSKFKLKGCFHAAISTLTESLNLSYNWTPSWKQPLLSSTEYERKTTHNLFALWRCPLTSVWIVYYFFVGSDQK